MNPIVLAGVAAALVAAFAVGMLVRPVLAGRMAWPALAATAATAVVTIGAGLGLNLASPEFLIGIAAFALPVLLLLEAAAIASGADAFARWVLMLVWGLVVFPAAALVPLALTAGCLAPDCGFEDFGAGLPVVVSATAFVLLSRLPAGVHERARLDRASGRRAAAAGFLFWGAAAVWLASLEGTVDEFTPRILVSAAIVPVAGAAGWLIVDVLRDTRVTTPRSLSLGLVAGMVAVLPGAVSVDLPWSVLVGLLAGALASLVYSLRGSRSLGLATRWAVTVLVAAAVGFLASPISGETVGLIFSARASVLVTPVLMFLGVVAFSAGVSAPVWLLVRRHATRERIPEGILVDE
ncbi:MAG: ammonium transporter [Schumannella sp.]|nr:ammonium transporter [Schumannella sp.]